MATEWFICEVFGGVNSFGATGIIAHTLFQHQGYLKIKVKDTFDNLEYVLPSIF